MSRVKTGGAKTSGRADGRPSTVVDGATTETSRSTLGRNSPRAEASRAPRRPRSAPGGGAAEPRRGRVDRGDVAEHAGPELDAGEGLPCPAQAQLGAGRAVGVVED